MGGSQTKTEEVILAQTAAGGADNIAHLETLKNHIGAINYTLLVICIILTLGGVYVAWRIYKKCHERLVDRRVNEFALQRYASLFRRERRQVEKSESVL